MQVYPSSKSTNTSFSLYLQDRSDMQDQIVFSEQVVRGFISLHLDLTLYQTKEIMYCSDVFRDPCIFAYTPQPSHAGHDADHPGEEEGGISGLQHRTLPGYR